MTTAKMETAKQTTECPVCKKMIDDDHFLPFADKCSDCYRAELAAKNDEIDSLFQKYFQE